MTTEPKKHGWIWAALFVVLAMIGAYVGGYFWLSSRHPLLGGLWVRSFHSQAIVDLYLPMGKIEAMARGETVRFSYPVEVIEMTDPVMSTHRTIEIEP